MAELRAEGFGTRVVKFFNGVKGELKKVNWPTRKELTAYTGVVLVAVAIVTVFLWIFDSALTEILRLLIHR